MGDFTLEDGSRISLHELRQSRVYEGLLEGLPTAERNRRYLREKLEQVERECAPVPVTLVEPVVKTIETREPYPFGRPEALPAIVCVGRFRADRCTRAGADAFDTYSELVVVWFQNAFALPIDPSVAEQLRRLDWDGLAGNFGD